MQKIYEIYQSIRIKLPKKEEWSVVSFVKSDGVYVIEVSCIIVRSKIGILFVNTQCPNVYEY